MIAAVRREIVPVGAELRALAWAGVMMIAGGVGIFISKHLQDIGPMAIATGIAAIAVACYLWVSLKSRAPLDDYVVLLGALLISADAAFIEKQWQLFGDEWQRHFLLLAIVHAAAAYWFTSRAVLSLSIAAFAAWLGIEQHHAFIAGDVELAIRAFVCAGALGVWREADRRIRSRGDFSPLFEHFGTNIAFWGALVLAADRDTRWMGLLIALGMAAASVVFGVRRSREPFIIYGVVYGLVAIDIIVLQRLHGATAESLYLTVSTIAAIATLIAIHFRFRRAAA